MGARVSCTREPCDNDRTPAATTSRRAFYDYDRRHVMERNMNYAGAARNTYRSRCGDGMPIPSASNACFTAFVKSHFTS